jgi:hypothetical protein
MDFCTGLPFAVMMTCIWLDAAGFWKWLNKNSDELRGICLVFLLSMVLNLDC